MRALLPLALMLAGCSDERPPAPTAADNAQLDEAGNMLDALEQETAMEGNTH